MLAIRLLLVGCALSLAACVDDTTPETTRYDTAVRRVISQYHLPGVAVSVRVPGETEWRQAYGYGDVESHTPMDLANHFSIRSVTKSFTVTLILQLVRDHAISLEDKLDKFVPGVPNGSIITIADLAGMQSGVFDYSGTPEFLAILEKDLSHAFTDVQLVGYAIPYSPRFAPGAQYDYSNTNTVLLGMIVEKVTGQTLAQALAQRILDPLGLHETSYPQSVPLPPPDPTPYEVAIATGATERLPLVNPTVFSAAGAMVSTLDDMQAWAAALGDGRLIGAELQSERVNRSRAATSGPHYDRYGLGLGITRGWWGHTGEALGLQSAVFYDPTTGATIAVLVNATPSSDAPPFLNFADEIFEALADVLASR